MDHIAALGHGPSGNGLTDFFRKCLDNCGEYAGVRLPLDQGVQDRLVVGQLQQLRLGVLDAGVGRLRCGLDHGNAGAGEVRLALHPVPGRRLCAQIDIISRNVDHIKAVGHLIERQPLLVDHEVVHGKVHLPGRRRLQLLRHGLIFHKLQLHAQRPGDLAAERRHGPAPGARQVPVLLRVIRYEIVECRVAAHRDGQHAPLLDGLHGVVGGVALVCGRGRAGPGREAQQHGQRHCQ